MLWARLDSVSAYYYAYNKHRTVLLLWIWSYTKATTTKLATFASAPCLFFLPLYTHTHHLFGQSWPYISWTYFLWMTDRIVFIEFVCCVKVHERHAFPILYGQFITFRWSCFTIYQLSKACEIYRPFDHMIFNKNINSVHWAHKECSAHM